MLLVGGVMVMLGGSGVGGLLGKDWLVRGEGGGCSRWEWGGEIEGLGDGG